MTRYIQARVRCKIKLISILHINCCVRSAFASVQTYSTKQHSSRTDILLCTQEDERPDAELTAEAPPPYDAAIHAQTFAPPPQYSDKEEVGLGYPEDNDAAYPLPVPSPPVQPPPTDLQQGNKSYQD